MSGLLSGSGSSMYPDKITTTEIRKEEGEWEKERVCHNVTDRKKGKSG